ncbi:MAG: hypothetical protein IT450_24265 [Phycisphaerales bacterium]|nr:hypothetical protein [Phycisphaerales bacterium]
MGVSAERARIASIAALITGVTSTSAAVPRDVTTADLPALIVMTGEGVRTRDGGLLLVQRTYKLALLVLPAAMGAELEAEQACEPFFERFEDAYGQRPALQLANNLTPLAGVQHSDLGNDTGVTAIELAGVGYMGVIFDLNVLTVRDVPRGL